MSGFEKNATYYRCNLYSSWCDCSSYLGDYNIDPKKLAIDLKMFFEDESYKKLDIVEHIAKKGDAYAHENKIIISLERKDGKIITRR